MSDHLEKGIEVRVIARYPSRIEGHNWVDKLEMCVGGFLPEAK